MSVPILSQFIAGTARCPIVIPPENPWQIVAGVQSALLSVLDELPPGYILVAPDVAVHQSASVAESAVLTGPVLLSARCRIGPGAVLRGGVWADEDVVIGPHSEIKSSLIFAGSAAAHRNYVGNSIIGSNVNLEAGAVLANHYNERIGKQVCVLFDGQAIATGLTKFGAILGDGARIGANAVTSPGTLLPPGSVVPRLGLVAQLPSSGPVAVGDR